VRKTRAGPRQVDNHVDHHKGHVHATRPHPAGNGLGQNSLRRLGASYERRDPSADPVRFGLRGS
jgi:hypothetical protein